jgi:hypothetical protein
LPHKGIRIRIDGVHDRFEAIPHVLVGDVYFNELKDNQSVDVFVNARNPSRSPGNGLVFSDRLAQCIDLLPHVHNSLIARVVVDGDFRLNQD